jgi:hypothetical protein
MWKNRFIHYFSPKPMIRDPQVENHCCMGVYAPRGQRNGSMAIRFRGWASRPTKCATRKHVTCKQNEICVTSGERNRRMRRKGVSKLTQTKAGLLNVSRLMSLRRYPYRERVKNESVWKQYRFRWHEQRLWSILKRVQAETMDQVGFNKIFGKKFYIVE